MNSRAQCPNAENLKELIEGTLPSPEQIILTSHLDQCTSCRQALDGLAADERWSAAARQLGQTEPCPEPALQELINDVKSEIVSESHGEPVNSISLDFLSPPEKSEHLGRLAHYEIIEVIGQGGMGVVLKAIDAKLQRVVAIKVMAPQLATSASARKRFIREAQAAAAIRNEHVIDIHAVDEANGLPFLEMEYISGVSLQQRIDRTGPLQLKEILRIGMQTAAGLAAAHAQGLIHRDIKPANIMLENGVERVKVTDFGLARAVDDASVTESGVIAGTPQYMAPEQALGDAVDHRADLFSLGSVLYAMCTGRQPFRGSGTMAVLKRVCEETPRPIPDINPDIPDWLLEIVAKLHAKNPADRFQHAAEVADVLGKWLAQLQHPSRAPIPAVRPSLVARKRFPGRGWAIAAAVLICLIAGLGLAEATGVSNLADTVIRLITPYGTLVVEVDDPDVKVAIEGDAGIVITGAGPQEVRVSPGHYMVSATKDGQTRRETVVTISRGGKEVVKISRESGARPAALASPPPALGEIRRFEGHTDVVRSVAFSPDGRYALSGSGSEYKDGRWQPGSDYTVRLWDVASGKELQRQEHNGWVESVAFSPDGRLALSSGWDKNIHVFDVEHWKELLTLDGHTDAVRSAVFSPDGRRVLSGSHDRTVRLWDVTSGKELRRFDGHTDPVWSVAFTPDGRRFLASNAAQIWVWDVESAKVVRRITGHAGAIYHLAVSPAGHQALSAGDDGLRLWDLDSGKERHRFTSPVPEALSDQYKRSGDLVDTKVLGNKLNGDKPDGARSPGSPLLDSTPNYIGVLTAAFSPDGRTAVSGGFDGLIRLWELDSGKELRRSEQQHGLIHSVAISPDGRHTLSGGGDGTVRLWSLDAKAPGQ